jgi:pimeloyl-ACP methyl ester carboxylesterase
VLQETVVLIHGLWMTGLEMGWLGSRLRREGYDVRDFHYHSLMRAPADNAERLQEFLQKTDAEIVHLVAHSLGGIVLLHLFERYPQQKPGRVLMLATPIRGSAVAHAYLKQPFMRPLMGRSIEQGILGDCPRWRGVRDLGMIAGNRGWGVGSMAFGVLSSPHDGTVAVSETLADEVKHHLEVPCSHFGLLFSRAVAEQVANYLQHGRFL